jgi:hypothetical protein
MAGAKRTASTATITTITTTATAVKTRTAVAKEKTKQRGFKEGIQQVELDSRVVQQQQQQQQQRVRGTTNTVTGGTTAPERAPEARSSEDSVSPDCQLPITTISSAVR